MQSLRRAGFATVQVLHKLYFPAAFYSVQVVVPSLGESISDGTIATVLKAAGDSVKENETIAQIETDKVTVDIKAPSDGTILGVVVQEQDTVIPGQLVATLDDSKAKAQLIGATAPQAAAPQPSAPATAAPTEPAAEHSHRRAGIRFPPRMTPDGQRISSLPAAEASTIIQQWQSSGSAAPSATPSPIGAAGAASEPPAAPAAQSRDPSKWSYDWHKSTGSTAAKPAAPSKFATSVEQLDQMPPRKELTDKDIELIELGGAL